MRRPACIRPSSSSSRGAWAKVWMPRATATQTHSLFATACVVSGIGVDKRRGQGTCSWRVQTTLVYPSRITLCELPVWPLPPHIVVQNNQNKHVRNQRSHASNNSCGPYLYIFCLVEVDDVARAAAFAAPAAESRVHEPDRSIASSCARFAPPARRGGVGRSG